MTIDGERMNAVQFTVTKDIVLFEPPAPPDPNRGKVVCDALGFNRWDYLATDVQLRYERAYDAIAATIREAMGKGS